MEQPEQGGGQGSDAAVDMQEDHEEAEQMQEGTQEEDEDEDEDEEGQQGQENQQEEQMQEGTQPEEEEEKEEGEDEEEEEEDEKVCRYCFDDESYGPLLSPCNCKGGQKYVHLSCLRRWQRMVLVSQPTHPAFYTDDVRHHECNVCKAPFTCAPPTRHELMQSFTGAEIAALIEPACIIAAHAVFSDELERQVEGMPEALRGLDPGGCKCG
jgi:hypothetical protein